MYQVMFWAGLFLLIYMYVGYAAIMGILSVVKARFSRRGLDKEIIYPEITLLIAAYNELATLPEKIANIHSLHYPAQKLRVLFVTDGSTDGTPEYLRQNSDFDVLHEPGRAGKSAALNRAMQHVKTPITIFTDANTFMNPESLVRLVQPYSDPRVGAVSGEKRVGITQTDMTHGAGEGLYWKYESALKRWDSHVYTVVGAAGELFSVRTDLYKEVPEDTILDDFVISLRIVEDGLRVAYVSDAFALESPSASLAEEMKRKIRICAGGFQSIFRLPGLFNIFKDPMASFQFVSHRVLRWVAGPVLLPVLFALNLVLAPQGVIYMVLMALQIAFYASAAYGWHKKSSGGAKSWHYVPLYFLIMNVSAYIGFWRFLTGSQSAIWVRASRASS